MINNNFIPNQLALLNNSYIEIQTNRNTLFNVVDGRPRRKAKKPTYRSTYGAVAPASFTNFAYQF